jgi:hypothetical protein
MIGDFLKILKNWQKGEEQTDDILIIGISV